jgi:hypothetical protein
MKEKIPKKKGRKPIYTTDEERRKADVEKSQRYYQKNREACLKKQSERYQERNEIIKKYKEGLLVEKSN